jgi:tripartite-type tricarboxylate transporter receptor subunit TctC
MKRVAVVALLLAAAFSVAGAARAQAYPVKPVRYIVPFPAAASPDIIARLLTERLSRLWGQQVVVDNRAGAGGTLGAAAAAKSPADGYTLFQCNIASSAIAESLYARMPYDHQRDFAAITLIGTAPSVFVVHPSVPMRTIKDFIAYARAHPGKLSYGTSALGTSPQLAMEVLKQSAKLNVVHVAYKGAPQALTDVIGGQIPMSADFGGAVGPRARAGGDQSETHTASARRADAARIGAAGTGSDFLVRPVRARGHARAHPRQGERRCHRRAAHAGNSAALQRTGARTRAYQPRGIRALHRRRGRTLGARHQGSGDTEAVAGAERCAGGCGWTGLGLSGSVFTYIGLWRWQPLNTSSRLCNSHADWLASFADLAAIIAAFPDPGKCAATYFDSQFGDHCDSGDLAAGGIWMLPAAYGGVFTDHPNAEGFLVRRAVPELATLALLGIALAGLGFSRRRV